VILERLEVFEHGIGPDNGSTIGKIFELAIGLGCEP
jgi:hypothetical protein